MGWVCRSTAQTRTFIGLSILIAFFQLPEVAYGAKPPCLSLVADLASEFLSIESAGAWSDDLNATIGHNLNVTKIPQISSDIKTLNLMLDQLSSEETTTPSMKDSILSYKHELGKNLSYDDYIRVTLEITEVFNNAPKNQEFGGRLSLSKNSLEELRIKASDVPGLNMLPTPLELSHRDIVLLWAEGILPIGIIASPAKADGTWMGSGLFAYHDISHSIRFIQWLLSTAERHGKTPAEFLIYFKELNRKVVSRIDQVADKADQARLFYLWYHNFHEPQLLQGVPILSSMPLASAEHVLGLKRIIEYLPKLEDEEFTKLTTLDIEKWRFSLATLLEFLKN